MEKAPERLLRSSEYIPIYCKAHRILSCNSLNFPSSPWGVKIWELLDWGNRSKGPWRLCLESRRDASAFQTRTGGELIIDGNDEGRQIRLWDGEFCILVDYYSGRDSICF